MTLIRVVLHRHGSGWRDGERQKAPKERIPQTNQKAVIHFSETIIKCTLYKRCYSEGNYIPLVCPHMERKQAALIGKVKKCSIFSKGKNMDISLPMGLSKTLMFSYGHSCYCLSEG